MRGIFVNCLLSFSLSLPPLYENHPSTTSYHPPTIVLINHHHYPSLYHRWMCSIIFKSREPHSDIVSFAAFRSNLRQQPPFSSTVTVRRRCRCWWDLRRENSVREETGRRRVKERDTGETTITVRERESSRSRE